MHTGAVGQESCMTPDSKNNDDIKQHLLNIEARLDRLSVSPQLSFDSLSARRDDEIDLREIWNILWGGKWIIMGVTALFSVGCIIYALSLPNIYESRALLAPSKEAQGGGMGRMVGQFGGLASLAGLSMGTASGDKVAVAIAVLQSRKFLDDFIEKYNLLPELMAVEGWDRLNNNITFDQKIYSFESGEWVREADPPKTPKPSSWEAYKVFMERLTVSKDSETGFVTVAVEHQSPYVAQRWVMLLVQEVNEVMKSKDVDEARRSVDFLKAQLLRVGLADVRTVFYKLIEEQTKTIMLAEVREEYVFSTIDPPVVAETHVKPRRSMIVILGGMLGGMLAVMIVFIRYFMRNPQVAVIGKST